MAEIESNVAMQPAAPRGVARRRTGRRFYVAMATLLLAMILVGFWPSYYGPLVRGAVDAPFILHLHGAVYIGWMVLLIVQTVVAARGRIATHRALGQYGIGLGVAVFLLGIFVSFAAPVMTFNAGVRTLDEAASFMLIPLGDMVLFGGLFFAAVAYRRKPEIHKRLMILATIAIAFAAIFRMQAIGVPLAAGLSIWFALPVAGIVYDWRSQGRVHPVYWIGIVGMAIAALRIPFSASETWMAIARPIVESLA